MKSCWPASFLLLLPPELACVRALLCQPERAERQGTGRLPIPGGKGLHEARNQRWEARGSRVRGLRCPGHALQGNIQVACLSGPFIAFAGGPAPCSLAVWDAEARSVCVHVCRYVGGMGVHRVGVHVCVCMFVCGVCMHVRVCVLLISHDHGLETWLLKGGLTTLPTTLSSPILASLSCCAGSFIPDQSPQPLVRPWGHGWWRVTWRKEQSLGRGSVFPYFGE